MSNIPRIVAIYGSPRRDGNTATLLKQAVAGARDAGADVEELVLRDLKISPCLEIYGCRKNGQCVIKDDFQMVRDKMMRAPGLMLASPIFYYAVSAHTKMLMDRCQSLWIQKYWLDNTPFGTPPSRGKGLFISAGATRGKKLFDGAVMSVRYFFDSLDIQLWDRLLIRQLDDANDALAHPEYLEMAYSKGAGLVKVIGGKP